MGKYFNQNSSGTLEIELGGTTPETEYDILEVTDSVRLGGELSVTLIDVTGSGLFVPTAADTFTILTAGGGVTGNFADENLPTYFEESVITWFVQYNTYDVTLEVVSSVLAGDFNGDGFVDGDDFLRWQTGFGTTSGATHADGDSDGDGDIDGDDFLAWQSGFGSALGFAAGTSGVPEPAALTIACFGLATAWAARFLFRSQVG